MTSISSAFLANATISSNSTGGSDTDKRIAAIRQQLQELQQQVKNLKDADIPEHSKEKLRKAFQQQIEMLTAELSRLQTERNKSDETKQNNKTPPADGHANSPATPAAVAGKAASSQIDLYV
ncbi:FlxA-like family protein [Neisseriaceae bacterium JH1-16]|nr:FlxA-like family protein [Neisseriaceae bacterium JH1-16]